MMQSKEPKMTKSETAAALEQKTQAADHASNFLAGLIFQLNNISDAPPRRMQDMVVEQAHGRRQEKNE